MHHIYTAQVRLLQTITEWSTCRPTYMNIWICEYMWSSRGLNYKCPTVIHSYRNSTVGQAMTEFPEVKTRRTNLPPLETSATSQPQADLEKRPKRLRPSTTDDPAALVPARGLPPLSTSSSLVAGNESPEKQRRRNHQEDDDFWNSWDVLYGPNYASSALVGEDNYMNTPSHYRQGLWKTHL